MIQIEAIRINVTKDIKVVDMQVSTVDELPAKNENVGGIIIAPGSIAQVIQTGAWYTLDDNGTWYDTDGQAASNASNNSLSMSPTLNKAIADSKDDMIDLTEDDIDRISNEIETAEEPAKEIEKSVLYPDEPELKKTAPVEDEGGEDE